jgi:hypothetical protein
MKANNIQNIATNRITDLKERQIYFEELAKELLKDLKAGWNPTVAEVVNQKNDLALIPALRFSLEKKALPYQKKHYQNIRDQLILSKQR